MCSSELTPNPSVEGEAQRHGTRPATRRGTSCASRAWRHAVGPASPRTLGLAMDVPQPGHFWKTPFIWEHGCTLPPATSGLRFSSPEPDWLAQAMASVMETSVDE